MYGQKGRQKEFCCEKMKLRVKIHSKNCTKLNAINHQPERERIQQKKITQRIKISQSWIIFQPFSAGVAHFFSFILF